MSRGRGCGRCCLSAFIAVAVVIILLVVAVVIVLNMTPEKLGFADKELLGSSFNELGLGQTKLIDMIKGFKGLGGVKESDIVTNPYDASNEATRAGDAFDNSSLDGQVGAESGPDFSSLLTAPVTYDKQYLVTYSDTTLAYIFNNIVQKSSDAEDAIGFLKSAIMTISEITVNQDATGVGTMRIVAAMSIADKLGDVKDKLGAASKIITVPEKLFIVSEIRFTVDASGKMQTTPQSICINGNNDDPLSKVIMSLLSESFDDENSETDGATLLNEQLGDAVETVVGNLGSIGVAAVSTGNVVSSDVTYGIIGVSEHKIKVITHTAA